MRATFMYGAGDVRVEDVPDAALQRPTDAVVRVLRACICGSDLHPYHSMPADRTARPMGHEFLGVVEEVGADVSDRASAATWSSRPFAWSDNTCDFCREGLQTSCRHGGFWGGDGVGGGQAEARPRAAGRRHPGQAARSRADSGAAAVAADPVRRVRHRPPRAVTRRRQRRAPPSP